MKQGELIILFITFIFLTGCEYNIDLTTGCADLKSLCFYVHDSIEYISDLDSIYEMPGYYQSPKESEELKTGDCEDYSTYFMFLAKQDFNIKPDFIIIFVEGGGNHAVTKYDGIYYDPTMMLIFTDLPDSWHVKKIYGYDKIMNRITNYYTKRI